MPRVSLVLIVAACTGLAPVCKAIVLSGITVTSATTAYSSQYSAANALDGTSADYATLGVGLGAVMNFSFGSSPQSFDRIVVVNRDTDSPNEWISNFTVTPQGGSAVTIQRAGQRGASGIHSMGGTVTTTGVSLRVDTVAGSSGLGNVGVQEVYFLRTPANSTPVAGVSVLSASTAFPGPENFVAAKAVDGIIGRSSGPVGNEYVSTAGNSLFVTFSMGGVKSLTGFDFFDRPAVVDHTEFFSLTFSQDATFGNADDVVKTYANSSSAKSDVFATPIDAAYVRYNVVFTEAGGEAGGYAGMSEMIFYQAVPESSSALCVVAGAALLAMKRRRPHC